MDGPFPPNPPKPPPPPPPPPLADKTEDLPDSPFSTMAPPPMSVSANSSLRRICEAFRRRGGHKYFISCELKKKILTLFIDTGADISIVPPSLVRHVPWHHLKHPFVVHGFRQGSETLVTHCVTLVLNFRPGGFVATFYVVDCPSAILGADVLRQRELKLSLETGKEIFKINGENFKTQISPANARKDLVRRRRVGPEKHRLEGMTHYPENGWLRTKNSVTLPPNSVTIVEAKLKSGRRISPVHTAFSLYDAATVEGADADIFIPSLTYEKLQTVYKIPVENRSKETQYLCKNFILCEIHSHGNGAPSNGYEGGEFMAYPVDELMEVLDERKARVRVGNVDASTPPSDGPMTENQPVKFSTLINKGRVDHNVLKKCYADGIEFDLKADKKEPEIEMEILVDVDVEAEKKKAEKCPYWAYDEFFENFNLDGISQELLPRVKALLWSFRHIFYNNKHPEMFRRGAKLTPVKIEQLPGTTLRKQRMRRMSPKALDHLQNHVDDLLRKGVIRQASPNDISAAYGSCALIVIEQKYLASEDRHVERSRLVLDARSLNDCLANCSYPLPLMDEFRAEVASKGARVFSNFDLQSAYNQLPIDEECAKRLFGMLALNRLWFYLRAIQGLKNSGGLLQSFLTRAFESHQRCKNFADDLSVYSQNDEQHVEEDLPKCFAICSFYRLLLNPAKSTLHKRRLRVLGLLVKEESTSIDRSKLETIKLLTFPSTKKELISRLAFFSYFSRLAPRLSELTAPLRKIALPNARFSPTEAHRQSFEDAKSHLLDEKTCCIRSPSSDPKDEIAVFTDASSHSMSSLLTQMMDPLDSGVAAGCGKLLHIIGVWSEVLKSTELNQPIWLSEMAALDKTCHKYSYLLTAREWFCITDSKTLSYWASLTEIPKSVARAIIRIQKFQFRLLHLDGNLNAADAFSRVLQVPPIATYKRFLEGRIVNARGEPIEWQSLFSEEKSREALGFFSTKQHQQLSHVVDHLQDDCEDDNDDDDDGRAMGAAESTLIYDAPEGAPVAAAIAVEERIDRKIAPDALHDDAVNLFAHACAVGIDDDDIEAGRNNDEEDEIDDALIGGCALPSFSPEALGEVENLQSGDVTLNEIRLYLGGEKEIPSKNEAMLLPKQIQSFLRNMTLFRISPQSVLMRIWTAKDETVTPLIAVAEEKFKMLVNQTHGFTTNSASQTGHLGMRKTFQILSERYFCFGGRKISNNIISGCEICRLNNYPATRAEKDGSHIVYEPNELVCMDFHGPVSGVGSSTTGRARYVLFQIDAATRHLTTLVTATCGDDDVMRGIMKLRSRNAGLPRRISADNALLTPNSRSKTFLTENGVGIIHGLATVSRCQSLAERVISTVMRLVHKYMTAEPSISFTTAVEEAEIAYNSSPCEGLNGKLSPRSLHFSTPPSTFLRTAPLEDISGGPKSITDAVKAARLRGKDALLHEVAAFVRRQGLRSPTDAGRRIRCGDICLRKRTSWASNSPRKQGVRVVIDAFEVESRVATNSFRCRSLIDGSVAVMAGDVLVKLKNFTHQSARELCARMTAAMDRAATVPEPRLTRARARAAEQNSPENVDVTSISFNDDADFELNDAYF